MTHKITVELGSASIERLSRAVQDAIAAGRLSSTSMAPATGVMGEVAGLEPISIYAPREREPLFLFIDTQTQEQHWVNDAYGRQQAGWRQAFFQKGH